MTLGWLATTPLCMEKEFGEGPLTYRCLRFTCPDVRGRKRKPVGVLLEMGATFPSPPIMISSVYNYDYDFFFFG